MDIFLLVIAAASLFGLALFGSYSWSIAAVWRLARQFGMSINVSEARALTKFYELDEAFLKACAEFKKLDPSISIVDVVRHHMADGDTLTLLEHWKEIQTSGADITFKSLILLDMGGKDISQTIKKQDQIYTIQIPDIEERGIHLAYSSQFKIAHDSAGWIEPNLKEFKSVIEDKIILAILAGDLSDFSALSSFISSDYLNEAFWKELCHGELIDQKITII